MEIANLKLDLTECSPSLSSETPLPELEDLQLALVGGGIGDAIR
jgi:hypothetical protein